jgi:hypothetical protein
LGWKISRPQEGNVFFQVGGVVLALFQRVKIAKDALVGSKEHDSLGFTLTYNPFFPLDEQGNLRLEE